MATPLTARLLAHKLPLPFYQHLVWGTTWPAAVREVTTDTVVGPYEARVVAAPGHAVDQEVLHVPERGWLFSADVFIHEPVKIFRRDEDFAAIVATRPGCQPTRSGPRFFDLASGRPGPGCQPTRSGGLVARTHPPGLPFVPFPRGRPP